jgi:hypothetical protein
VKPGNVAVELFLVFSHNVDYRSSVHQTSLSQATVILVNDSALLLPGEWRRGAVLSE